MTPVIPNVILSRRAYASGHPCGCSVWHDVVLRGFVLLDVRQGGVYPGSGSRTAGFVSTSPSHLPAFSRPWFFVMRSSVTRCRMPLIGCMRLVTLIACVGPLLADAWSWRLNRTLGSQPGEGWGLVRLIVMLSPSTMVLGHEPGLRSADASVRSSAATVNLAVRTWASSHPTVM